MGISGTEHRGTYWLVSPVEHDLAGLVPLERPKLSDDPARRWIQERICPSGELLLYMLFARHSPKPACEECVLNALERPDSMVWKRCEHQACWITLGLVIASMGIDNPDESIVDGSLDIAVAAATAAIREDDPDLKSYAQEILGGLGLTLDRASGFVGTRGRPRRQN